MYQFHQEIEEILIRFAADVASCARMTLHNQESVTSTVEPVSIGASDQKMLSW